MSSNPTKALENLTMSQLVDRMGSAKERPSDRPDLFELADKVEDLSMRLAVRDGRYKDAELLTYAVAELRDMDEKLENAVATVSRLLDEIRDLRDRLPRYERQPQSHRYEPVEPVRVRDRDEEQE